MEEFRESPGRVGGFGVAVEAPAGPENMILGPEPSSIVTLVSGVRLLVKRLADECLVSDGLEGGAAAIGGNNVSLPLGSRDSVSDSRGVMLLAARLGGSVGVDPSRFSVPGSWVSEPIEPYPADAVAVE